MGDVCAFVLAIGAVLIGLGLLLGWIRYKIDKLKDDDKLNIETIGSIIVLEKAMKKLNGALRSHDRRLDNHLHEISDIKNRLDILEAGHPDTDIDYGEVDDQGEIICVWFEGKKYVPEDKRAEETNTFYADNKVVAETTRPKSRYTCADCVRFRRERVDGKWRCICSVDNVVMSDDELYICDKFRIYRPTEYYVSKNMAETTKSEAKCCATCQHYRPESGFSTCDLRTWLHATKKYATMADSACNNYEEVSKPCLLSDKGEIGYICGIYEAIGGNGEIERLTKKIADLNYFYNVSLISAGTYMHRWEELIRNDS